MGLSTQDLMNIGVRFDIVCTIPKSVAAVEKMIAYGAKRGTKNAAGAYVYDGDIAGKTFIVTDSKATGTTAKTVTFARSDFSNPSAPTLDEIVTAINAVLSLDATPTVASAGANGELVITQAATDAAGVLTIGAGTANVALGFPDQGYVITNGAGVSLVIDAQFSDQWEYSVAPRVDVSSFTVATGVLAALAAVVGYTSTWTPSTRTLLVNGGSDATQRAGHIVAIF